MRGGLLTTGPIVNGSVVNGRFNDPFVFIFLFEWQLGVAR